MCDRTAEECRDMTTEALRRLAPRQVELSGYSSPAEQERTSTSLVALIDRP